MSDATTSVFTATCLEGRRAFITGGGTGICRGIAEELQGELHAEAREGGGTRVVLRVPALVKEADAFQVLTQDADPLSSARILVVDNEPAIVRSLKRLLRVARVVDTATSGRDALERILVPGMPDPEPDLERLARGVLAIVGED